MHNLQWCAAATCRVPAHEAGPLTLVALYAFIAGLVAGWVMQPDAPATRTPANRDPLPWWLGIAFGLAWPVAAAVLVLLVGSWWLDGWRPDPRDAAPSRPAGRGTSHMGLP